MGEWTHLERSQLAYERFLELTKGVRGPSVDLGRYGDEPGQYPPELNATSRLWYERDGRFRQERDEGATG